MRNSTRYDVVFWEGTVGTVGGPGEAKVIVRKEEVALAKPQVRVAVEQGGEECTRRVTLLVLCS